MYNQSVPDSIYNAMQALKGVFAAGPNNAGWNSEQLDMIQKTFGISSGFQPYDLSAAAYYLQPVFSPLRNRFPRLHLQGKNMEFKSITNVNVNNVNGLLAEGGAPNSITTQFADVTTYFKAYGLRSDPVTFQQLFAGVGKAGDFNIDSRAIAAKNLLEALFISEERFLLAGVGSSSQVASSTASPDNGFDFTIGGAIGAAPSGGSVTNSTSAGTIPAATYSIVYTAVSAYAVTTGMPTTSGTIPYSTTNAGESLQVGTALSTTLSATGQIIFTPPTVTNGPPIIGWKVYIELSDSKYHYAAFTTGAPVTITALPTTSALQPPTTDQSAGTTVSGGTGSSVEGSMNGVLAWLFGVNSGASFNVVNGLWTLDDIIQGFADGFTNSFADPDTFWLNATDLVTLTSLLTGNNGGLQYWFAAPQGNAQGDLTGGFRVARWLNPVTSKIMVVDVHAYLPQGTAMALTDQLPPWFVGNNVPDCWVWGGSMDYLEIDYQPTPTTVNYVSDIMCQGGVHCFLPNQNLLWTGISA